MENVINNFGVIFNTKEKINDLRNLILELAIKGKLVKQDDKEEPAKILLEKIDDRKKQLYPKNYEKIEVRESERKYQLPFNWEWGKLGNVIEFKNGYAFKSKDFRENGIGIIKIGNIQNGEISENKMVYFDENSDISEEYQVLPGDLLIAMSGATTGKVGFNKSNKIYYLNQRVGKIIPILINVEYLCYFLSIIIEENLSKSLGSAIPNLSTKQIKEIALPIPPLEEQKRIVEKLDQLMQMCDELETNLERKAHYKELTSKSLSIIVQNSHNQEELISNLSMIVDNFKVVYSTKENINNLKSTILQIAFQGKLVPQNPDDEPASVLLEKIKAEKEQLIKDKVIKKSKALAPISGDEKPFELPNGWEWVKLDEICSYIQRGKSPKYVEISSTPVISQKCVQWDGFKLERARFIDENTLDKYAPERFIREKDLLWNSTGHGTLGRVNLFKEDYRAGFINIVADSHVTVVRSFSEYVLSEYIYFWLSSPAVQSTIYDISSGSTKQLELSTTTIKNYLVPVPPLNEQKKIIEVIRKLLTICNALISNIDESTTLNNLYTKSVLKS